MTLLICIGLASAYIFCGMLTARDNFRRNGEEMGDDPLLAICLVLLFPVVWIWWIAWQVWFLWRLVITPRRKR